MTTETTGGDAPGIERFSAGRVLPAGLPFPEGVRVGALYFLSGQIGNVPGTLQLVEGGIESEATQALQNIRAILRAQGLDVSDLVRCTVMLADIGEWPRFNEAWRRFFAGHPLPELVPIATADFPRPARRPVNSVLDCTRIGQVHGIVPRPWREALADVGRELRTAG